MGEGAVGLSADLFIKAEHNHNPGNGYGNGNGYGDGYGYGNGYGYGDGYGDGYGYGYGYGYGDGSKDYLEGVLKTAVTMSAPEPSPSP